MIRCAEEIGTLDVATAVLANVGASSDNAVLPDAVRRKLLVLEAIGKRVSAEALPTGWLDAAEAGEEPSDATAWVWAVLVWLAADIDAQALAARTLPGRRDARLQRRDAVAASPTATT